MPLIEGRAATASRAHRGRPASLVRSRLAPACNRAEAQVMHAYALISRRRRRLNRVDLLKQVAVDVLPPRTRSATCFFRYARGRAGPAGCIHLRQCKVDGFDTPEVEGWLGEHY